MTGELKWVHFQPKPSSCGEDIYAGILPPSDFVAAFCVAQPGRLAASCYPPRRAVTVGQRPGGCASDCQQQCARVAYTHGARVNSVRAKTEPWKAPQRHLEVCVMSKPELIASMSTKFHGDAVPPWQREHEWRRPRRRWCERLCVAPPHSCESVR